MLSDRSGPRRTRFARAGALVVVSCPEHPRQGASGVGS